MSKRRDEPDFIEDGFGYTVYFQGKPYFGFLNISATTRMWSDCFLLLDGNLVKEEDIIQNNANYIISQ